MHIFFRHNAFSHLLGYSNSINITYMHWEIKKIHVTPFTATFALLRWSGTKPTVSLRYACGFWQIPPFFPCRVEKEKAQAVEQQAKVSEQKKAEDFKAQMEAHLKQQRLAAQQVGELVLSHLATNWHF